MCLLGGDVARRRRWPVDCTAGALVESEARAARRKRTRHGLPPRCNLPLQIGVRDEAFDRNWSEVLFGVEHEYRDMAGEERPE